MSRRPFASRLLAWFPASARDLPWRRGRTPYAVVVSELMLQQTTVAAVVPYFERFMASFPSWEALASAPLDDVLAAWAGLGYYRRARSLHALARAVVASGGEFPRTFDEALALPGVGPYTAGAVLSMAHGVAAPAVDGNVARVLSRHRGEPWRLASARDRRAMQEASLALMPRDAPGAFNEALIELGATVCTPREPACLLCPVGEDCVARRTGRIEELPPPSARAASRAVSAAAAVVLDRERVLLRRRADDDALLPGMWELPGGFVEGEPRAWLERRVLRELGGGRVIGPAGVVRHAITTRRITLSLWRCELTRRPRAGGALRWVAPGDASALAITAATAKALKALKSISRG